ncbi:MAG: lipopolysaccharide kinase InaA family protein [Candidatus Brocadiia bacterium]
MVKRRPSRLILHMPGLGVLKVLLRLRWRGRLASLFRTLPYVREFDMAKRAAALGVPVAQPVFASVRRRGGLAVQAAILFESVPGAISLDQLMRRSYPRLGPAGQLSSNVCGLMAELGKAVARLHAAGGAHGDLAPRNVLLSRHARQPLTLIDWAEGWEAMAWGQRTARRGCSKQAARDLGRRMSRLVHCGTRLRAVAALLRSYYAARGFGGQQGRQLAEELAAASAATLRARAERVMDAATRGTRRLGVRAEGDRVLCYRKEPTSRRSGRPLPGHRRGWALPRGWPAMSAPTPGKPGEPRARWPPWPCRCGCTWPVASTGARAPGGCSSRIRRGPSKARP